MSVRYPHAATLTLLDSASVDYGLAADGVVFDALCKACEMTLTARYGASNVALVAERPYRPLGHDDYTALDVICAARYVAHQLDDAPSEITTLLTALIELATYRLDGWPDAVRRWWV